LTSVKTRQKRARPCNPRRAECVVCQNTSIQTSAGLWRVGAPEGRPRIELVNAAFLKADGTAEQFRDGIKRAVDKGWMVRHESGTYVKFTPAGAELIA
jgi:hypothetical protein